MGRRRGAWLLLLLLGGLLAVPLPARAETIVLVPDERASWSPSSLLAVLRPRHYLGERKLEIETTPPGASLDLFYVRAGFQKCYEQSTAPATVLLPRRVDTTSRDSVTVRAFAEGYRHQTVRVRVGSSRSHVLLELEPLPNTLRGLAYTYFVERASLTFLLAESPTVRLQKQEDGFAVILAETARDPDVERSLEGIRSPLVRAVDAQQIGEDLLVQVRLAQPEATRPFELRSREDRDPIRGLHRYTLDLVPPDRGSGAVERARAALARLSAEDVNGCAGAFDAALRRALDPTALARALTPRGEFTDPFLRAALRRLGELSPEGRIRLADGSRYRPDVPLELSAAASQAASAHGYLALLDRFVREVEAPPYRAETLRSLVAPELDPSRFAVILSDAEAEEARCRRETRDGIAGSASAHRRAGR